MGEKKQQKGANAPCEPAKKPATQSTDVVWTVMKSVLVVCISFICLAAAFFIIVALADGPVEASEPNITVRYSSGGHSKLRLEPGREYRLAIVESPDGKSLTWWKEVPDVSYMLKEGKLLRKEKGAIWDSEQEVKPTMKK
jgi:hypothetical protein